MADGSIMTTIALIAGHNHFPIQLVSIEPSRSRNKAKCKNFNDNFRITPVKLYFKLLFMKFSSVKKKNYVG